MERYLLQKSEERPKWWVLTDIKYGVVCRFEQHKFNETQEFCVLEDKALVELKPNEIAKVVREMTDWAADNHYPILMSKPIFPYSERLRVGSELRAAREKKDMSIAELASLADAQTKTIANIEAGRFNANLDLLSKIARCLGGKIGFKISTQE